MDTQNGYRLEGRQAVPAEIERMSGCVYWMYARGQPVVLWLCSGSISLVPDTLPVKDVVFLVKTD